MEFTYNWYKDLLKMITSCGYTFADYQSCDTTKSTCIMRHDIDCSIEKAYKMCLLEQQENVKSTYFVMTTSDFYNVFSKKNLEILREIHKSGHSIGLHFDELAYENLSKEEFIVKAEREKNRLEDALGGGLRINAISMHRPSKTTLEEDWTFQTMVNSYSKRFFKEFKYVSDSRRRWREPILDIIKSKEYKNLHILTHAFWYNEEELPINQVICNFVNGANKERYLTMADNITDLSSIMSEKEIK